MSRRSMKGFTLIELLIVVAIIGIIAAIAIPNLLNAIDRGKQKRTMADMRSVGTAIESYAVDTSKYPIATNAQTLATILQAGAYIKNMPQVDGWQNTLQVTSTTVDYTVFSMGKDGTGNDCTPGTTTNFNNEICFNNGQFTRYPSGAQQ